jgi:hypothetical protein
MGWVVLGAFYLLSLSWCVVAPKLLSKVVPWIEGLNNSFLLHCSDMRTVSSVVNLIFAISALICLTFLTDCSDSQLLKWLQGDSLAVVGWFVNHIYHVQQWFNLPARPGRCHRGEYGRTCQLSSTFWTFTRFRRRKVAGSNSTGLFLNLPSKS